jgi:hypothetical protein
LRGVLPPQVHDQLLARHNLVGLQQRPGEHSALPHAANRDALTPSSSSNGQRMRTPALPSFRPQAVSAPSCQQAVSAPRLSSNGAPKRQAPHSEEKARSSAESGTEAAPRTAQFSWLCGVCAPGPRIRISPISAANRQGATDIPARNTDSAERAENVIPDGPIRSRHVLSPRREPPVLRRGRYPQTSRQRRHLWTDTPRTRSTSETGKPGSPRTAPD